MGSGIFRRIGASVRMLGGLGMAKKSIRLFLERCKFSTAMHPSQFNEIA
jgi:hypothetical protein